MIENMFSVLSQTVGGNLNQNCQCELKVCIKKIWTVALVIHQNIEAMLLRTVEKYSLLDLRFTSIQRAPFVCVTTAGGSECLLQHNGEKLLWKHETLTQLIKTMKTTQQQHTAGLQHKVEMPETMKEISIKTFYNL